MTTPLALHEFVARWQANTLSERAAAQSHFNQLCQVLGEPSPAEVDPTGRWFTFEKGVTKASGGRGWADVWRKDCFAWEYKGRHKDLDAAYRQLQQYREDLGNPPLLVVCDLDRFIVHTNFTSTIKHVYSFSLADLLNNQPTLTCSKRPLDVIHALFRHPDSLKPFQTREQATKKAASEFATLATSLRRRGHDPAQAAHFLMRLLFCLFAEDIGLLRPDHFTQLVRRWQSIPDGFTRRLRVLFHAMAHGGDFGIDAIPHFNGGLFADDTVIELTVNEMKILAEATELDWGSVEPSIFGTLFERGLDPFARTELGAHFTSHEDIELIVEPVLMTPLRREWLEVREQAHDLINISNTDANTNSALVAARRVTDFFAKIAKIKVLDPACGSGNFLYVALKKLLDLEQEIINFAHSYGLGWITHQVRPSQLYGIERNTYARELSQIVVWIGYIQWLVEHGVPYQSEPILETLQNIERKDAILGYDNTGRVSEPDWPKADVIISNPPFLGGKFLRRELRDAFVDEVFSLYEGRVPHEADLVCYWFERARAQIGRGFAERAGLLATQGIRGGANRKVLERIKATGDVFMAWSDREWVLDGASVRVSMVGFDHGVESGRVLNGQAVGSIHANLTAGTDLTMAQRLAENLNIVYMGDTKGGAFDIGFREAETMLRAPLNPNGRSNVDVVRPWVNGLDVTRRPRSMWIIDFGVDMPETAAALYELPYEYVRRHVRPERLMNNRAAYRERWWLHVEPRPTMRASLAPLRRYICTARVAKHRLFTWLALPTLPDSQLFVFAREDDYFFGVIHSRPHELWALRQGTALTDRPRYTPTTTFETFPLPWPPGEEPTADPRVEAIADAARDLVTTRDAWLNPPGASDTELKDRTLTRLYNERPTWLDLAHQRLDAAVFDAYGWPHDLSNEALLQRLLELNLSRPAVARETSPARPKPEPAHNMPMPLGPTPLQDSLASTLNTARRRRRTKPGADSPSAAG
jgi:type II restriction/modification system DNA methylase subunit YeeA